MNPVVNLASREFSPLVQRCNELQRQLRSFHTHLARQNIKIKDNDTEANMSLTEFESQFTDLDRQLQQFHDSTREIDRRQAELIEMRNVLETAATCLSDSLEQTFFQSVTDSSPARSILSFVPLETGSPLSANESSPESEVSLSFIAGIVPLATAELFQRMLFFSLRGNLHIKIIPLSDPLNDPSNVCYPLSSSYLTACFSPRTYRTSWNKKLSF